MIMELVSLTVMNSNVIIISCIAVVLVAFLILILMADLNNKG